MKYTFALLFVLLAFPALQAQEKADPAAVEKAVAEIAKQYQLNAAQREKAVKIQERRLRNLAEIAPLRDTNYKLYLEKKQYIRQATQASLQRLLTEAQMPVLKAQMLDRRKREAKLIDRLKTAGASREEIQIAVWELE